MTVIRLIRPVQWVKNSLVLAPLIFSGAYRDGSAWLAGLAAFAAFSFTAGSVYAFNDVMDAKVDRLHPAKKDRPVASGAIRPAPAIVISILLLAAGLGMAASLNPICFWIAAGYALLMLLYSLGLKHVMLLDVLMVACGLTMRALFGAEAIRVDISHWLLICAFLLSLMLALVKRRQELARIGDDPEQGRRSLRDAPPLPAWDMWINSVAGITILAYILYTVDERTVEHVGSSHLLYTTPFVIYGILRYLGRVQRNDVGEDPTVALLADPAMWVAVLGWLGMVLLVLGGVL